MIASLIFLFIINLIGGCENDYNNPTTTTSSEPEHSEPEPNENFYIETAGRLLISDAVEPVLTVLDLDNGQVLARYNLITQASAILVSPAKRYGLIVQQQSYNQENIVQLIDGGIWRENHGNQVHDYQEEPQFLEAIFSGTAFHRYTVNGNLGALFFASDTSLAIPAKVLLLSESSLGEGREEAILNLDVPMDGLAVPIGDWLLTTQREPDATTFWPSQVVLYKRYGKTFEFQQRFEERWPDLDDSTTIVNHTAFSCEDGILVIEHQGHGDAMTFQAKKIYYPSDFPERTKISTLIGHPDLTHFFGFAPSNYSFSIVDPQTMTIIPIEEIVSGFITDALLDTTAQRLLTISSHIYPGSFPLLPRAYSSEAVVLVFDTHDWHTIWQWSSPIRQFVIDSPKMVWGKNNFIYIAESQVHEIDLNTLNVRTFETTGAHIAYVGITEH